MKKKSVLELMLVLIIILFVVLSFSISDSYEIKEMSLLENLSCITTIEECRCIGNLFILESFPEQYNCKGYEMCESINTTTSCQ